MYVTAAPPLKRDRAPGTTLPSGRSTYPLRAIPSKPSALNLGPPILSYSYKLSLQACLDKGRPAAVCSATVKGVCGVLGAVKYRPEQGALAGSLKKY